MIDHLNNMLRHLFMAQINQIADEAQVRFQPPDRDWRTQVGGLQHNALNVYPVRPAREPQAAFSHE